MKRIAIIGGGISGLSAAFALEQQKKSGAPIEYVLFESSARFGGVIHTKNVDGCVVEAGPDSFLTEKPWAADLCRELGMGDQLIGSNDAERKTYILVKGRLVPLPDGLQFMVPTRLMSAFFSPLFSLGTKARIVREWFYRPGGEPESTVAEFVGRHYGREMVERVADPLLAGVYGGARMTSVSNLSCRGFWKWKRSTGAWDERWSRRGKQRGAADAELRSAGQPRAPAPTRALFTSLKDGMGQMVDALLARIPERRGD